MRIGLVSDTHSNVQILRKIVYEAPPVEMWLHAGDHYQEANVLAQLTGVKVIAVQGNTDPKSDDIKIDEFLELEGFKVWLTHGHRYIEFDAKSSLGFWAKQLGQDICVYGHTHIPMCEYYGENLLINPGSPSRPRGGSEPSYAILTVNKGEKPVVDFYNI